MKRKWTNRIRYFMDEWVPPAIRDTRWFIWPFAYLAYGGRPTSRVLDFKKRVYSMTDVEYSDFYRNLGKTVSRSRETDLNEKSLEAIVASLPRDTRTLVDVGSGNGYLLRWIAQHRPDIELAGVDVVPPQQLPPNAMFKEGQLPRLPFESKSIDVVTCTHVLEHVIDVGQAVAELRRVAAQRVICVVPRQRYYYYTLDEHVNFFQQIEPLSYHFKDCEVKVSLLDGDWFLDANVAGA